MRIIAFVLALPTLFVLGTQAADVYYPNNVTRAEAIKVASQLRRGMWEEDVSKRLATNGLKFNIAGGTITGWHRYYGLSDGTSLHLDYRARKIARDGRWGGNGELRGAFIESNEVNIVSIALTNSP